MMIFDWAIFISIIPLLVLIALGFGAGRIYKLSTHSFVLFSKVLEALIAEIVFLKRNRRFT